MFECKICGFVCSRGSGHIKAKHQITTLDYLKKYEELDIVFLYNEGYSAKQIADKIKQQNIGINPIKKDILCYLRANNIEVRNTSEATKCWSDKRGGPWNKNLTKEEHPSIMKYSVSRMGEDNGYYKASEESRQKTRWWEYKTEDEIRQIRRKGSETLKELYKEGKLIPYGTLHPEWAKENQVKRMDGFRKYLISGNKHKFGNPSLAEREIADILEEKNIRYIRQASVAEKYSCDLLLLDYNIVLEYYGTYWHCDPRKYEATYYNQKINKTASQVWQHDLLREESIKEHGYKLIVIWEEDYKRLNMLQKRIMINEAIENKISNKTS
jgi:G:T-mismatch repair DNA endonuclease (very short patch repair protein)